jgi:malic enzyme
LSPMAHACWGWGTSVHMLPYQSWKALLFKYLGVVDAFPLCLAPKNPDDIVQACNPTVTLR